MDLKTIKKEATASIHSISSYAGPIYPEGANHIIDAWCFSENLPLPFLLQHPNDSRLTLSHIRGGVFHRCVFSRNDYRLIQLSINIDAEPLRVDYSGFSATNVDIIDTRTFQCQCDGALHRFRFITVDIIVDEIPSLGSQYLWSRNFLF